MFKTLKLVGLATVSALALGGCDEISQYFALGDPAEVSSCEIVLDDLGGEGEGLLCVECNSASPETSKAKSSQCGVEISARCKSALDHAVFGIALGGIEGDGDLQATFLTGTAWVDDEVDPAGPSENDSLVCHQQSAEGLGKQEWKCTTAEKGKKASFEIEIKYDESKNDCDD